MIILARERKVHLFKKVKEGINKRLFSNSRTWKTWCCLSRRSQILGEIGEIEQNQGCCSEEGDGGQRKNSHPDTSRWLSGKSSHFHASSFIQLTCVPAYSFARLWDPRRWARAMWPFTFMSLLTDTHTHTVYQGDIPSQGFWTELIIRLTSSSYGGRISLPVNCITVGCICCFLVQIFVKMTVPHCIHPHGLHLAVIHISQPIMHLSYVLH